MKFFAFHLMPYPTLVDGYREKYGGAWTSYPNSYFDPEVGRTLYPRYIDELVLAAEVGFDGICVNEHHQTNYGLMPSPNLIAGMLVQRTQSIAPSPKIAILGNALPLRPNPMQLAEEIALLDVISGGRIISGFVRGIGAEYHTQSLNPSESHGRFFEAHDLIVKAWTQPGPFRWDGEFYNYRYVNPWPRPLQQPHPPIWIPSTGSTETIVWAAEHDYTYLQLAVPSSTVGRFFDQYRETAQRCGHSEVEHRLGWSIPIYVAPTDAQAEDEAWPALDYYQNHLLLNPAHMLFPPNYLSEASLERVLASRSALMSSDKTFKDITSNRLALVGSPETVAGQIEEAHAQLGGFGHMIMIVHFGSLSHDKTVANIRRIASEVLPKVRSLSARQEQPI